MAIGVNLFLAFGGLLVLAGIAFFWLLLLWQLVGCAWLGWELVQRSWAWRPTQRDLLVGAGLVVVAALYLVVAVGNTYSSTFNWDDDIPGYMYLTNRLLATGGLIDPFNFRRASSYGGAQLYEAIVMRVSGAGSLQAVEFVFAPILAVALTVMTLRRRWLVLGVALLALGVAIVHPWSFSTHSNVFAPPLPVTNLAPEFSATALTLTVFALAGLLSDASARGQKALSVLIGLCAAGLLALRFTVVIGVVVAVLVAVVTLPLRRALTAVGLIVGAFVVSSLGWAVASLRSSATPIFALVPGNYDTSYQPAHDPFRDSLNAFVNLFWKAFQFNSMGFAIVACLAVAVVLWVWRPQKRSQALVLLGAALGCLVELAVFTRQFNGTFAHEVARYEAPSMLACVLFAVGLLWPVRPGQREPSAASRPRGSPGRRQTAATWAFVAVALAGLAVLTFGYSFSYDAQLLHKDWRRGTRVLEGSTTSDPYPPAVRAAYAGMNKKVPRNARVLAAVDDPGLLSFSRFQFATLDFPGAASPPPHLPLFAGADAVVRYLRRQGYDYVLADSPTAFGFYNRAQWQASVKSLNWNSHQYGRYFLQWSSIVDSLEHDQRYHTLTVDRLTLIDLR